MLLSSAAARPTYNAATKAIDTLKGITTLVDVQKAPRRLLNVQRHLIVEILYLIKADAKSNMRRINKKKKRIISGKVMLFPFSMADSKKRWDVSFER